MHKLKLGLTKTYNLFHSQMLDIDIIKKASKQSGSIAKEAFDDLIRLRDLHAEMDNITIEAYGWKDIELKHNFYDIEYLPENDRTRYTISPEARREILKRLLKLNHELYAEEVAQGLHEKKKKATSKKVDAALKKGQAVPGSLF